MGISITGYIETRSGSDGGWRTEIPLGKLFHGRDRDGFECLFGVAGWAGFEPVAAERGLPEDVSAEVRADFEQTWHPFGASWITRAEVEAIDGDEVAADAAFAVYHAEESPDGEVVWRRVDWRPEFNYDVYEEFGLEPYDLCTCDEAGTEPKPWPPGAEWIVSPGVLHRVEPLRRIDVVGPNSFWEPLWQAMGRLAEQYGDTGVRLVVWFFA